MDVIESRAVESKCGRCHFIRVRPCNIQRTLREVLDLLTDMTWLSDLNLPCLHDAYKIRAERTLAELTARIQAGIDDGITGESGEYVVSVVAAETIASELKYPKRPLAELIGEKATGNPGFDFHNVNPNDQILIFGEAKYKSKSSAHQSSLSQIHRFIEEGKDVTNLIDLQNFCSPDVLDNVNEGNKGFAAAFSARSTSSEKLIEAIVESEHFKYIEEFSEIVLVAVDLW